MNKKKVIFIIPHLGSSGAECVVANLCRGLDACFWGKVLRVLRSRLKKGK